MAMKKIRLDFSKTEERSVWNTRHIAEGLHKMKVDSVQETEAQDSTAMLIYALVPEDPRFKSRRFPYYCKLQQNQLWKLRDLLVSAGQSVPKKAISIDPSVVVGKYIAAEVQDATGQFEGRSEVQGTYGLDILDENGDNTGSDEEDEDEGDEEEYDDEEVEDEGEDLSDLTLAELRKRAKGLGIDTAGLKKDDLVESIEEAEAEDEEDDDLDDWTSRMKTSMMRSCTMMRKRRKKSLLPSVGHLPGHLPRHLPRHLPSALYSVAADQCRRLR